MSVKNNFVDINGNLIEDNLCVETDSHGLMCPEDKVKLDGIETGANKTIVDTELSSTSTNPVQNKVVNTALDDKLNIADLLDLTDEEITNICTFDGDGDNIIPIASQTSVGCVAVGNGLNVDTQGTLNVTALTEEELKQICDFDEGMSDENIVPKASKSLLGCVVVGNGLSVDENGTITTEGVQIAKLWENASPTSAFAAQSITLNNGEKYDAVIVTVRENSEDETTTSSQLGFNGIDTRIMMFYNYRQHRRFHFSKSTGKITFYTAYNGNYNAAVSEDTTKIIPETIYGIKGVL